MSWQRGSEEDRIEAEREGWANQGKPAPARRKYGAANQESLGWFSWLIGVGLLILGVWGAWALFEHFNAGQ